MSLEEAERGVVGDELDGDVDSASSASAPSAEESIATAGKGWDAAKLNRRGTGRDLLTTGGGETRSPGGGVILTLGEETTRLFPLRTELLLPPRLQETADSDLEGGLATTGVVALVIVLDAGVPRDVPPLMTVVELGVGGRRSSDSSKTDLDRLEGAVERVPNFPPRAAVMGKELSAAS
jgi:hypothetical protein